MIRRAEAAVTTPTPPRRHRPWCRGHFHCPHCDRTVCGRASVVNRDGTARRVVCLACGATFRARKAAEGIAR